MPLIRDLFASDISRHIEEVIKVDQTNQDVIKDEISEYVATKTIQQHFIEILERYFETPQKPHEGIAVWVSGFFGSGKSSFAKMLGLALDNQDVRGTGAGELFSKRVGNNKLTVVLKSITERIATDAIIFDVSTDRGIRSGNQTITEIMYRLFLQSLGYARDLDLAELEIALEADGHLAGFKETYARLLTKDWDREKGKTAFAISEASLVMHELNKVLYPAADSWAKAAHNRADITPGRLAERCKELMVRRRPGKSLVFVIDEVGQFVARDVQKMLDLQAVVQSLGRVGRGKMWIVVTSQEKLTELVGGLDDKRVELARLMDRFPLQVHLEASDISEVTSRRVLAKNADAQEKLRTLFEAERARLAENTRLTADIRLPELTADGFINLYPLLPYQVDLIIQVVSGLRTQGGASSHVGGANRTIIKLAQQLLIRPDVNLAAEPVGKLARIDQIYDLVSSNIASEIRAKIDGIESKVPHPSAQRVAKSICLLQFVKSIHRTPENIAATLHPACDASSTLADVKAALEDLVKAHMVRLGDDGYRIPSPVEDDWERQRVALSPKPADVNRIYSEIVNGLWTPQPSHSLLDIKPFKAALFLNGRPVKEEGDIPFHLDLAEPGQPFDELVTLGRKRSQTETKSVFWIAALNETIDRKTVEVFRSKEILSRKERGAQTKAESALVAEEKTNLRIHLDDLRALLKQTLLAGTVFFRGNDRSPDDTAVDVGKTTERVLAEALPEVFSRFEEAAARVKKGDLDSVLTTENLRGLTSVFTELKLLRDQGGQTIFDADTGPLAEILHRIEDRASYGETATGRSLTDDFAKEPFGWDFDVVRLFIASLMRAGKIEAVSQGQTIEAALSLDARAMFQNNNLFRQASFRPKIGIEFIHLVETVEAFKDVFGREIPEIEQAAIANAIRTEVSRHEESVQTAHTLLVSHSLPGVAILRDCLDQMRAIRNGNEEQAIQNFRSASKKLKEGIKRGVELVGELNEARIADLQRARRALRELWPFLDTEADIEEALRVKAKSLDDTLKRETFYRELPVIDQLTRSLEVEYQARHKAASDARVDAYEKALKELVATPGWEQLNDPQRQQVSAPLRACSAPDTSSSIPQLRSDTDACPSRLRKAVEEMLRLFDGARIVSIPLARFFSGGIDTPEQLDAAIAALREAVAHHLGAGKKVLLQ